MASGYPFPKEGARPIELIKKWKRLKGFQQIFSDMIPEPYAGLLLGTALSLIVSSISMILANHFSHKQWRRQKEFEQKRETIEQLYSPLYFFLENLEFPFSVLKGNLAMDNGNDIVIPENFIATHMKPMREQINHVNLRRIIEKKLAFLKPLQFRREIIVFMQMLRGFEEIFDVWMDLNKKKSELNKPFQIIRQLAIHLDNVSLEFRQFLLNNILDKDTNLDELNYESVITQSLSDEIWGEITKFAI